MHSYRNRRLLLAAGVLATLGGCADLARDPDGIEVSEVRRLSNCGTESGAAAVTLLPTANAVRDWQRARGIDLTDGGVLPPGAFAVVEHGARNTGGYSVAVLRQARSAGDVVSLYANFLEPNSELRAQMLTSPCVLVALPPGDFRIVELLDSVGRRRAISNEPPPATASSATPAR